MSYLNCFQGAYTELTDSRIQRLTQEEILDTVNNKNVSGIFMKDFKFIDLLGNIIYGDDGKIVGRYISSLTYIFLNDSQGEPLNKIMEYVIIWGGVCDVKFHNFQKPVKGCFKPF